MHSLQNLFLKILLKIILNIHYKILSSQLVFKIFRIIKFFFFSVCPIIKEFKTSCHRISQPYYQINQLLTINMQRKEQVISYLKIMIIYFIKQLLKIFSFTPVNFSLLEKIHQKNIKLGSIVTKQFFFLCLDHEVLDFSLLVVVQHYPKLILV